MTVDDLDSCISDEVYSHSGSCLNEPGSLVKTTKDVFLWAGNSVNKGSLLSVVMGSTGIVLDNEGQKFGFYEHDKVMFDSGVIGYVPRRWLLPL